MPAPLQPTPLDPSAQMGLESYAHAFDGLVQGGQVEQPKVPPVPASAEPVPPEKPAAPQAQPAPQQPTGPTPDQYNSAFDALKPQLQAQPNLNDTFDRVMQLGAHAPPPEVPQVPIAGQPQPPIPVSQEQADEAATAQANQPEGPEAITRAFTENYQHLLPEWVPGAQTINSLTASIAAGKEAIVQGMTSVGLLKNRADQERVRRDLNMAQEASMGPIPEAGMFSGATNAENVAMDKVLTDLPNKVEATAADTAAKTATTPEQSTALVKSTMEHYWGGQDAAVDNTTKQIGMQEVLDAPKPMTQPIMSTEMQVKAVQAGQRILAQRGIAPNSLVPQTVQETVAGLIRSNQVAPHEIFLALQDANMTPNEFADAFVQSGTDASHMLLARRQFWDGLRSRALAGDQDAAGILQAASSNDELRTLYQRMTADWKMALVSNMSVAMRNLFDGMIYLGQGGLARGLDVLTNKIARTINPELPTYTTWGALKDVNNLFNPLQVNRVRQQVGGLAQAFPEITKDLGVSGAWRASQVAPGAAVQSKGIVGHALALLTTGHQLQEGLLRRAVFAASLDRKLATIGSSMADILKSGEVPKGFNGMMRDSIHDALDAAWSLDLNTHGSSQLQNAVAFTLKGLASTPGIGPLMEAFPRYLFTQIQHVLDYQPLGLLKVISPTERAALAAGEPNGITKAIVGTGMMGLALAFKHGIVPGVDPGNTWDSVKMGNQSMHLGPFGTLAPYMYMADLYDRYKTGRIQEGYITLPKFLEGMFGNTPLSSVNQLDIINRAIDTLSGAWSFGDFTRIIEEAGSEAAGLFNPLRQFFDFASEWEKSLRITRDSRGQGFIAQTEKQVAPTEVPTKPNPTKAGPEQMAEFHPFGATVTGGMAHQLTGARFEEGKSPVQQEMDRLGYTQSLTAAHLGVENPRAQALIDQSLGPLVDRYGPALLNSPAYKNGSDAMKAALLHDFFKGGPILGKGGLVGVATQMAEAQAPNTFANIAVQKMVPVPDQHAVDELMRGRLTQLYKTTKESSERELTGLGR